MDDKSFNIRVPKKWVRMGMVAVVTALIVAPLTAYAIHDFTDVPTSNTFHDDISAIADAGVTLGCNPPANDEYCPDDNVTREQMAAFMNRLGALGPGKTPVANAATAVQADNATTADSATTADNATNADTVDNLDANSLVRVVGAATDNPSTDNGNVETVNIDAPVDGFLFISSVTEASDANEWFCGVDLNGSRVPDPAYVINVHSGPDGRAVCANTMTVAVEAGSHTVDLETGGVDGSLNESSISVLFVPFGGDGAGPAAFTALGQGGESNDE